MRSIVKRGFIAGGLSVFLIAAYQWRSANRDFDISIEWSTKGLKRLDELKKDPRGTGNDISSEQFFLDSNDKDMHAAVERLAFWRPIATGVFPVSLFLWVVGNWVACGRFRIR